MTMKNLNQFQAGLESKSILREDNASICSHTFKEAIF